MIFMLKKNLLPLISMVLVLGLGGLVTHIDSVQASAFGRSGIVTVPKKMQGTWYSYDRDAHNGKKITFTAHTVNGRMIYVQDKDTINNYLNGKIKNQKTFDQTTQNWMSGRITKMKNDVFYEIDPWITFEKWSLYRVTPQIINGKQHNVLVYSSRYDGGNYYRSKKLAKQMKNFKFEKVNYTM
ncbi:hypothetical protein [Lactobacillus ultunensis]|uniref:hypothetical protein n=1 Tax=Lactobacillus ultunensis TaxID=227945 RepID=UPI001911396C|nr:hypothetical protein [Lactobacillus ultunensis]QQP29375.1 hypothetical protein H4B44_04800 [Lactobacillus ultunensis]